MKRNKKSYLATLIIAALMCGSYSCSSDNDDMPPSDKTTSTDEISETLNNVSTDWGASKKAIEKYMKGYREEENNDTTVLQFSAKKSPITIVYQFAGDYLCSAAIKAKKGDAEIDVMETLKDFIYVGESNGCDVYTNESKNVFAAAYSKIENDDNYQIIGFTPLLSIIDRIDGKETVDLGLSVKWANCNIGATKPEEYGNYYAWGETSADKKSYTWDTYAHCDGSLNTCKMIGDSICGTSYDAATVNWGSKWQTPTRKQLDELRRECDWIQGTIGGINGYYVFGKTGNYIFLPAGGWKSNVSNTINNAGYYMSSTRYNNGYAYCLKFSSSSRTIADQYRYVGMNVRAVIQR